MHPCTLRGWRCDELVWNCHGRWCCDIGRSGALEETKRNAAKERLALRSVLLGGGMFGCTSRLLLVL